MEEIKKTNKIEEVNTLIQQGWILINVEKNKENFIFSLKMKKLEQKTGVWDDFFNSREKFE